MKLLGTNNKQLKMMSINAIRVQIIPWSKQLYFFLEKYNVSYNSCFHIACSRALYAIRKIIKGSYVSIFEDIKGTEHAVAIYNAYIRHERTNYDIFCEEVSLCMCGSNSTLSGNEIKELWRRQYPAQHDAYEKKCIFIDEKYRRVYNQHFKYL